MTARWPQVRAWRDRLRVTSLDAVHDDLSPQGQRAALDAALDALSDDALARVAAMPVIPWRRAGLVTTATVSTAALEWLAVLLGRGTEVTWKVPHDHPGLADVVRVAAAAVDLPLHVHIDRDAIQGSEVVIVMGNDHTVASVRRSLPDDVVVHGHGHAWSCAWVTGQDLPPDPRLPADFQDPWGRVAADVALHDGRGCLSPVIVYTPQPLDQTRIALAGALQRAQTRWPRGRVHPHEAARERTRRGLARVLGHVEEGAGWSVHELPLDKAEPSALPRSVLLVHAPDAQAAADHASQWRHALSTVGTDDPDSASVWRKAGATRIDPTGRMQRPDLDRIHDGVRWVLQAARGA